LREGQEIDEALRAIRDRVSAIGQEHVPHDTQLDAVRHFWRTKRLPSLKDGRLVSFGLCVPPVSDGPPIMEDCARFGILLDELEQWADNPRCYRRCYQGLLTSYFRYDIHHPKTPTEGKQNWIALRQYLAGRLPAISTGDVNPEWVTCALSNREVLSDTPCASYAKELLKGEGGRLRLVRSAFLIDDASWFLRELIVAQVVAATNEGDDAFRGLVSRLLALIKPNLVLRDRGLGLILDRYAALSNPAVNESLRNCAIEWWGNPWLPSNKMRWGSVTVAARQMVANWLKAEFVESFFTLLAEEGTADRRRLEFWKRYVKSMDKVQFALGSDARFSRAKDFVELRAKMKGATVDLKDSDGSNNAFLMTIGDLVVVEFSGRSNALYGYSAKAGLPFTLDAPVVTAKDARNSLKRSRNLIWLRHADGIHGWARWEGAFEDLMRRKFGIAPDVDLSSKRYAIGPMNASASTEWTARRWPSDYNRDTLNQFAQDRGLMLQDNSRQGGNLWVLAPFDASIDRILKQWGFTYRSNKGWWK
jgi:hypothetical protein